MSNRNTLKEMKELFYKMEDLLDKDMELSQEQIEAYHQTVPKIENKTTYRGFYLQPNLAKTIDKLSNKKRGFKSDLVNVALKEYLGKTGVYEKRDY